MRRLLALAMLVAVVFPSSSVRAQSPQCFAVPGITNCIEGRFLEFWQQNGGLAVFGYPITAATQQTTGEGTFLTQYFERNRFEYHADKARPYDVLLGRLGDDRLKQQGRDWNTFPKGQANGSCVWFAETSHSLCEPFKSYWEGHGLQDPALNSYAKSLALFGLPLSEPAMETNSSGDTVITQWFERARFENHGTQGVLLGLLGNETHGSSSGSGPTPTPPPNAPNQCADAPQPISATIRPSNCVQKGTLVRFDVFGFTPNENVGFWLTTPDGDVFGTVQTYNIGPTGAANGIDFDTGDREITPGLWYWVFQGVSSQHKSIVYIKVLSETPPPPGPTPTPPPGPTPTPTPAPAPQNVEVSASVSNSRPTQNSHVTVYGHFHVGGHGVGGVPMETTWHYKTTTSYCSDTTNGNGDASCERSISRASKNYQVDIDVTFTYNGQTYTAYTSFTPQ